MSNLFRIKLTIPGKPELSNGGRAHWAVINKQRQRWHAAVARSIEFRPIEPLKMCSIICHRYSSNKCDYDNLVYSFKPVVDGLVNAGIIVDDDLFTIVERKYLWSKTSRDKPFITIEVMEIDQGEV